MIPTLYFHRVSSAALAAGEMEAISPGTFERQMRFLKKKKFVTVTAKQVVEHYRGNRRLPPRAVALTFDDATSDHWGYVFPILEKYGHRGTFFVPTAKPGDGPKRPNLNAARDGSIDPCDIPDAGVMTWAELLHAAKSGVIDVESHTHLHARHPSSPRVVGFTGARQCGEAAPWGTPVYEDAPALVRPRYFPSAAETEEAQAWVVARGGAAVFDRADWEQKLFEVVRRHRERFGEAGRYETHEEFVRRVEAELSVSRRTIEERLDRVSHCLAWPHGEATAEVHAIALRAGFQATFVGCDYENPLETSMFARQHFGEDYRGAFSRTIHYWRFVQTVETSCRVGWRRHLAPALRFLVRRRRDAEREHDVRGGS